MSRQFHLPQSPCIAAEQPEVQRGQEITQQDDDRAQVSRLSVQGPFSHTYDLSRRSGDKWEKLGVGGA